MRPRSRFQLLVFIAVGASAIAAVPAYAQAPTMLNPSLGVRAVVSELNQPVNIAFIGPNDFLLLEKATGRVRRVTNGTLAASPALDLAVNSNSERGLLGIAVHPRFPDTPFVYLYWSESTTGADSTSSLEVPLLGNRVDRFLWNGTTLTQDINLIKLRAFQHDAGQNPRGNHDGGVITFGHDGKLYIFIGDVGRRGQTQNLVNGPFGPGIPDDQFGGPQPDNAHMTGVIIRLNDDGSTPTSNPFYAAGAAMGGEVGSNVQKIFSYGHRNSFGIAIDPYSGNLWLQENGDDAFSELNLVDPGMNGGWIQFMGPASRIGQFKAIETSAEFFGLQQIRWPPTNIADSPEDAFARLFILPGSHYSDPEFSWKFEVAPGGIGFVKGRALGPQFEGDLFMGGARDFLEGGHLFHFNLTGNRRKIAVDDPRLADRVADNLTKWEITESESLLIGRNFGIVTDIESGPNGNLFLVSLTKGTVYEIFRTK